MRKLTHAFVLCSFLLLLSAGSSQAMMMRGAKRFSGKLHAVTKLGDRYKLRIDKRIMFILMNDDKRTSELIKTAKSLLHKKVTVTYKKNHNIIIFINSFKKKKLY